MTVILISTTMSLTTTWSVNVLYSIHFGWKYSEVQKCDAPRGIVPIHIIAVFPHKIPFTTWSNNHGLSTYQVWTLSIPCRLRPIMSTTRGGDISFFQLSLGIVVSNIEKTWLCKEVTNVPAARSSKLGVSSHREEDIDISVRPWAWMRIHGVST